MARLTAEVEYEELYQERRLMLKMRMSKHWTLLTFSALTEWRQCELFVRQDQPHAPSHVRKLVFQSEQECSSYLEAKRIELDSEGWREETGS